MWSRFASRVAPLACGVCLAQQRVNHAYVRDDRLPNVRAHYLLHSLINQEAQTQTQQRNVSNEQL